MLFCKCTFIHAHRFYGFIYFHINTFRCIYSFLHTWIFWEDISQRIYFIVFKGDISREDFCSLFYEIVINTKSKRKYCLYKGFYIKYIFIHCNRNNVKCPLVFFIHAWFIQSEISVGLFFLFNLNPTSLNVSIIPRRLIFIEILLI